MVLDYSLKTVEERIDYVNQLLADTPSKELNNQQLTYMSDYILFVADKNQTKKEHQESHPIVTKNREATVGKRQVSLEEVVAGLENGEDGLYALINQDKNQLLDRKEPLSERDYEEIPQLKEQLEVLKSLQRQFENAPKNKRFSLKKQIIETWQQMYILKASARGIPAKGRTPSQIKSLTYLKLDEDIYFDDKGMPQSKAIISLLNPAHVSFLLCYYSILKQECIDNLHSDMYFLLLDLENLVVDTLLEDYEELFDLVVWKIDGKTNEEIQELMESKHGITHNEQYFSALWRKRVPKMIAEAAQKQWIVWYYTNEKRGIWKKCGKCDEIKLAHPLFYSKNNSSKDGCYSICKECRSK